MKPLIYDVTRMPCPSEGERGKPRSVYQRVSPIEMSEHNYMQISATFKQGRRKRAHTHEFTAAAPQRPRNDLGALHRRKWKLTRL